MVISICRNSGVYILRSVITVNIVAHFYVTTVNVTEYFIILISIIIGVGDSCGAG